MIDGALTANELALLRTRPQRTQLYLAIPEYTAVYTAVKDGTPVNNDNTVTIPFRAPTTGVITDIKLDMMVLVSSVGYGLWDAGIARIRKDGQVGDTVLYIGITSDIDFADGMFLTVINDYSLWPRHPYIDPATEVVYMDYDVPYYSQNVLGAPIPIMGTHAVLELTGATVTTSFDASDSYGVLGTPVTYDYVWTCAGATVVTPNAVSTDIIFNAAGTYLVELEITADFGGSVSTPVTAVSLARRYVVVYDATHPLNKSFILDSCSGDYDSGNWSYRVTMRDNADEVDIRDRTLCMLVAKDWYGDTQQSIGPIVGRENIVCVGWVDGDSIRRSNDKSSVSFEVQGPAFWLGVQEGFPTGVDDTNVAPTDWIHIQNLTTRKGLYHFLRERTTAISIMDCFITDDTHRLPSTYTPAGSLLDQLRAICQKINAKAVCNRYGQLYCMVDTQFIASGLRLPPPLGDFPVAQTLTDRDWREEITIERKAKSPVGQVDLSGVYYSGDFATSTAIFSLAPGHYPRHYGSKHKIERIALTNQTEANLLAGLWLSYLNNEFPTIDVPMSSNYRAIDIAPWSFVQMNLAAGDTPRGIAWTNKKIIPRRIEFNYDAGEAVLLTDIEFEAEVEASEAITGDPPIEPPPVIEPPPPPTLCNDPTAINFGLPAPCVYPPVLSTNIVVVMTKNHVGISSDFFTTTDPHWVDCTPALGAGRNLLNFQLCPSGELYILQTALVGGDDVLWYCADVTAPVPILVSLGISVDMPGTARAMGRVDNAIYFPFNRPYPQYGQYSRLKIENGQSIIPLGGKLVVFQDNYHFSAAYNDNSLFSITGSGIAFGASAASGGRIVNEGSETAKAGPYPPYGDGPTICYVPGTTRGVWDASGLYQNTMSVRVGNIISNQVTGARPVYEDADQTGGHYFWTRNDAALMLDDSTVQAIPVDSGPTQGVFSSGGPGGFHGGAYCCFGGYGNILWVSNYASIFNSRRNIAYTEDGGVTWLTKDGDWLVEVGSYEGGYECALVQAITIA